MATTFNWIVENLECDIDNGVNTNVVKTVYWRCTGVDGEYSSTSYGSCNVGEASEDFTSFEDLTLEQVLDWCYNNGVNKTEIEDGIQSSIDTLMAPKVTYKTPPWEV